MRIDDKIATSIRKQSYESAKDNEKSPFQISDQGVIVCEFTAETDLNQLINAVAWAIHEDYCEEIK